MKTRHKVTGTFIFKRRGRDSSEQGFFALFSKNLGSEAKNFLFRQNENLEAPDLKDKEEDNFGKFVTKIGSEEPFIGGKVISRKISKNIWLKGF